jgi:hypothetical protein
MLRQVLPKVAVAVIAAVTLRCSDAPLITRQASRIVLSETFASADTANI